MTAMKRGVEKANDVARFWAGVALIDKLGLYMAAAAGYNLYQRDIGVANAVVHLWGVSGSIFVTLIVGMFICGCIIMIGHGRLSPKHKALLTTPLCVYVFLVVIASFLGQTPSATAALHIGLLDIVFSTLGKPQSYDLVVPNNTG